MIDRILHITNKLSGAGLGKEDMEKTVVEYSEKGMPAAIHFLVSEKGMDPANAGSLMKKIEAEYIKMNKELVFYKSVFLLLLLVVFVFSTKAQSPFFMVVAGVLSLLRIFSIIRFIRNNAFTPSHSLQQP